MLRDKAAVDGGTTSWSYPLQAAQNRYRPRRRFDGPIVLFKATAQEAWTAAVYADPLLGWERWATGGVESHAGKNSFYIDDFELLADTGVARPQKAVIDSFVTPQLQWFSLGGR